MAKTAGFCRKEKLGKGRGASGLERFMVSGGGEKGNAEPLALSKPGGRCVFCHANRHYFVRFVETVNMKELEGTFQDKVSS